METLRKQVARVQRRLILGRFVAALAWSWLVALAIAAVAIAVAKVWPLGIASWVWAAGWICGALGVGLLVAAAWTWFHRDDSLSAAIAIDQRFGLKERVSSALALPAPERDSGVGQALVSDAVRRVERIDVGSRFKLTLGRRNLLPLLPALLIFGLTFLTDRARDPSAQAAIQPASRRQIQQSVEALRKKLAERKREATEKGLKDAGDLFKKIEQATRDLAKKEGVDRKQALRKLNDLAKQLEQRRDKLGGNDLLKQQLGQLKDMKNGPAEKLADALKNGDFDKARKEVDKIANDLRNGRLDPQRRQQLAKQLATLQNRLGKMAQKHRQAVQNLRRRIDQSTASGNSAAAKNLQQQLARLQRQASQMSQLQKLAGQCKQCGLALASGKSAQPAKRSTNSAGN